MQSNIDLSQSNTNYTHKVGKAITVNSSFVAPNGENVHYQAKSPPDAEAIEAQKKISIALIDDHVRMAKKRASTEYQMQRHAIEMKAAHDLKITECAMEQSEAQAFFGIDQEYQQRKLEIEQKSQEQSMQIETTASQLILTAQQQKMQHTLHKKMTELNDQLGPTGRSTPNNMNWSNQ
jgi:hypothetical protein